MSSASPSNDAYLKGEPIGFVGLGAFGAPMVRRLVALGWQVLVFDVNAKALEAAAAHGARAMSSPKAIAQEAGLVFTCLPSLEALRAVTSGRDGLLGGGAMRALIDFSTTGAKFAVEQAQLLAAHGVMRIDAPVTGNVVTAGNGKLGVMCSGPQAAFDQAEAVMHDLASAIVLYLGEQSGRAQTLKLLNNLLSASGMASAAEAFVLGAKVGLDPRQMLEVINAGDSSSSATRNKFATSILPRRFDFGARMAITAKDISLSVGEAEDLGVPMWVAQSVRQLWRYAVSQGGAERDGTSLITYLEPWAGVEVKWSDVEAVPAPGTVPACEADEIVLLCEPRMLPLAQEKLRAAGVDCTLAVFDARAPDAKPEDAIPPRRGDGRRIVVNMGLVSSSAARRCAVTLSAGGDIYVDAVPAGTIRAFERGTGSIVVSGPASAVAALGDVLGAFGQRIFHVSEDAGAGQVMQQINASLFAILFAVTCESYVAGAKAGLDPLTMKKILGIETGRNAASERIVPEQIANGRFDEGKPLGEVLHELNLLSDEARSAGFTPWILDRARLLYGLAAQQGLADKDLTRLMTLYESWAGCQVRSPLPCSDILKLR